MGKKIRFTRGGHTAIPQKPTTSGAVNFGAVAPSAGFSRPTRPASDPVLRIRDRARARRRRYKGQVGRKLKK
jgi:hypothetical protein